MGCSCSDISVTCAICYNLYTCSCWEWKPGVIRCRCNPNNKFSWCNINFKKEKFGEFYACPLKCRSVLKKISTFEDRNNRKFAVGYQEGKFIETNKVLSQNCGVCRGKGKRETVLSQKFEICQDCKGTGGIKCNKHYVPKFGDKTIECAHCGYRTNTGWVAECKSCKTDGQICTQTIKTEICKCEYQKCNTFKKMDFIYPIDLSINLF